MVPLMGSKPHSATWTPDNKMARCRHCSCPRGPGHMRLADQHVAHRLPAASARRRAAASRSRVPESRATCSGRCGGGIRDCIGIPKPRAHVQARIFSILPRRTRCSPDSRSEAESRGSRGHWGMSHAVLRAANGAILWAHGSQLRTEMALCRRGIRLLHYSSVYRGLPPGACTLQYTERALRTETEPGCWRFRRPGEEYRASV